MSRISLKKNWTLKLSQEASELITFLQVPTAIPSRKKRYARGWCVRKGSLLKDRLPVKFQDVKYLKFKHDIFVRIDIKHLYFSTYYCLPSIFSAVEIIMNCLLFAKI